MKGSQIFAGILVLTVGILTLSVAGFLMRGCNEAADVAHEEFGARASLKKYEWFKDANASLAAKRADIQIYETRARACDTGSPHRDERQACRQAEAEVTGLIASHNALAAEYNSASSKFNWGYAEGNAPPGSENLPRTVKPYISQR